MDLKGKAVTIIGAAKSGIAAANLVQALGGTARIAARTSDDTPTSSRST